MKKKNNKNSASEISKLKKDKSFLLSREIMLNNLIAELLFLRFQSEAFNKAQKLFLFQTIHELKTPLNAICGFSRLLEKEEFDALKNKKHQEYVSYISSSAQMLLLLLDNMINFYKFEKNEVVLNEEEVDLSDLLKESIVLIQTATQFKNKKIYFQPIKNVFFKGDKRILKQIFLNILLNSLKFTLNDGKINISLQKLSTGIRLIFKDNGVGIKKEKLKHLFDPFCSISPSFNKIPQGMGLGLVLVKKMVILHQGRVIVKSRLNKGTVLMIDFPKDRLIFTRKK